MRWVAVLFCLSLAVRAAEQPLYRANWETPANNLDGWVSDGAEAVADPQLGPSLLFPTGATSPRIKAPGNHRIRIRYTLRKPHASMLYVSANQFARGAQLWKVKTGSYGTSLDKRLPALPDPTPVEVGFLTEPETDEIVVWFSAGGTTDARTGISGLAILDAGPPPDVPVDAKELLEDGGWEQRQPRESLPSENSYGIGSWMGWNGPSALTVTRTPGAVHSGRQALVVRPLAAGAGGLRPQQPVLTVPDAWYDFSVWARGQGTVQLWLVNDLAGETVLVSADDWRQLHLVYCADNPAQKGFSPGLFVRGRVCIDDMSVRQVAASDARRLIAAGNPWPTPPKVVQTVPAGEQRSTNSVVLENRHVRVTLSPLGGGHIVELVDRAAGKRWRDLRLAALVFPDQPVPVEMSIPFATTHTAPETVTFTHTIMGGPAAVFLDGVRVEATFTLGPEDRAVDVVYRLTNTSRSARLPNPAVVNSWPAGTGIRRLAAAGEEGTLVVTNARTDVRNLTAGWMAASSPDASLAWGFDATAAQEGSLDPAGRQAGWTHIPLALPPGGVWETHAWIAAVPLPAIAYADRDAAVDVDFGGRGAGRTVALRVAPLGSAPVQVRARLVDYGGEAVASADTANAAPIRFTPPAGRFVTLLDIRTASGWRTVELFNDQRAREQRSAGIEGAGETQYRPTVPVRVLRLPDAGDLRTPVERSKQVLWAKGLFSQYYPFESLLAAKGYAVENLDGGGGFPEDLDELAGFRAVILSNIGAAQLSALARGVLAQYVRGGGRLLVTGGSSGLGNALTAGTDLGELLPAVLEGPFDAQPLAGRDGVLRPGPDLPHLLTGGRTPRLYWAHRCLPRDTATVLAFAGRQAVLAEWSCGRGEVVLFTGTVEGDPRPGETAAWEWDGWGPLWSAVLGRMGCQ